MCQGLKPKKLIGWIENKVHDNRADIGAGFLVSLSARISGLCFIDFRKSPPMRF